MLETIVLYVACAILLATVYFLCITQLYTRATRLSVQATSAYQDGDISGGDQLSAQARELRERADKLMPFGPVGKGDDDD